MNIRITYQIKDDLLLVRVMIGNMYYVIYDVNGNSKVSKVVSLCRGRPEGSLLNSYYTKV